MVIGNLILYKLDRNRKFPEMLILGDINKKPKCCQKFIDFGDRIFKNYFGLENGGIRKSVKQNIVRRLPKVSRKLKMV